jgi:hypothetical protein
VLQSWLGQSIGRKILLPSLFWFSYYLLLSGLYAHPDSTAQCVCARACAHKGSVPLGTDEWFALSSHNVRLISVLHTASLL